MRTNRSRSDLWHLHRQHEDSAQSFPDIVLKGRLRGYAVGLVQLFREVPCPDLMARCLLDAALKNFRNSAHYRLMQLVAERDLARLHGTAEEVANLDAKIHEHTLLEQLPRRWDVDFLFSQVGYQTHGDPMLAVWAVVLIEICTLEQHWESALLGLPATNPYVSPGFHPDKEVYDTAWLKEARRTWTGDVGPVLSDALEVLTIVVLPEAANQELNDEAEPARTCSCGH